MKKPKFKIGDVVKSVTGASGKIYEIYVSITDGKQEIEYYVDLKTCECCGHITRTVFDENAIVKVIKNENE